MPEAVQTIDDFLRMVRKSGLVDEDRLAETVAPWPDVSAPLPQPLIDALIAADLLTDWQVEQLRRGRHQGFVLGKYRLLRLLGAGGMSSVYLAEHTTLRGKVAIKVLPVKRVDKTSYLARFEREAREAFRLTHPNIVRTLDLDTSGKIHFIVMEYVEGDDLNARVKRTGPLDIREAADFIRQAALGLEHAHEEGLVHRDIKPANLIVDKRGTVKILDFGLALAGGDEGDASLTQAFDEKVLGTADYLAPEQVRNSHQADRRSDVYALGCTFHFLLTGRAPFANGSISERLQAHLTKPPPNLLEARPDVPPALVELYFRMMDKHPTARPQTAQEVADALAAWLAVNATGGPRARPEPPRRTPPPRRSPSPGGDPGSSNVHFAAVRPGRTGSDSGSSGVRSGSGSLSGGDSGPLGDWAGGTAGRGTAAPTAKPRPGAATARTAPVLIDTGSGPAGGAAQVAKKVRKPLQFAGLPLGFWLLAAGALVLASVLGYMVLAQNPAAKRPAATKEPAVTKEPATDNDPAPKKTPAASRRPPKGK